MGLLGHPLYFIPLLKRKTEVCMKTSNLMLSIVLWISWIQETDTRENFFVTKSHKNNRSTSSFFFLKAWNLYRLFTTLSTVWSGFENLYKPIHLYLQNAIPVRRNNKTRINMMVLVTINKIRTNILSYSHIYTGINQTQTQR